VQSRDVLQGGVVRPGVLPPTFTTIGFMSQVW
jgi:hypothetical protein